MVERASLNGELRGDVGRRNEAVGAILGRPASLGLGVLSKVWVFETRSAVKAGGLQPKNPRGPVAGNEIPLVGNGSGDQAGAVRPSESGKPRLKDFIFLLGGGMKRVGRKGRAGWKEKC